MLSFLSVFAVSVGALVAVRSLDIECAEPHVRRVSVSSRVNQMFPLNAITGTR